MPHLETATPEGLTLSRELAGAGSRFAAAACDAVMLGLSYLSLLVGVFLVARADPTGISAFVGGILGGGLLLWLILYLFLGHLLLGGQSPGKSLFRLRVVSADGFPASPTQLLLRSLLWPIDALMPFPVPFGLLGLAVLMTTPRRQRPGDLVAGTVVVRERAPATARTPGAPQAPAEADGRFRLPAGIVARLGEEDHLFLRDLLARHGLDPSVQRALLRRSAAHFAERLDVRLEPADDPRQFLRAVHRELRHARGGPGAPPHSPPQRSR